MPFYMGSNKLTPKATDSNYVPIIPKKYNLLERVKDDNNNEIGTVAGFFVADNDVEYAIVVLDARYRLCSTLVNILAAGNHSSLGLSNHNGNWTGLSDTKSATYNTQAVIDFATSAGITAGAFTHARQQSFTIGGTVYYGQIPNLPELCIIGTRGTAINAKDTSVSSYSQYAIPRTTSGTGNTIKTCSSTIRSKSTSASSGSQFFVITGGGTSDIITTIDSSQLSCFILPILELPNT